MPRQSQYGYRDNTNCCYTKESKAECSVVFTIITAIFLISFGFAFGGRYRMAREGTCISNNGDGTVKFQDGAGIITNFGAEPASFIPHSLPASCWTIDETSFTNYNPTTVFIVIMALFGTLFMVSFAFWIYNEDKEFLLYYFNWTSWILFGLTFIIGICMITLNYSVYLEQVQCTGFITSDDCTYGASNCECSAQPCVQYIDPNTGKTHKARFEYWTNRPTFYPVDCWTWTQQDPATDQGDHVTLNDPYYVLICFAIYIGCHVGFNLLMILVHYLYMKALQIKPNTNNDIESGRR